jgi:hypothetical protein
MAAFDTHQAVRRLTAAGVDEEPAEAIVEVVGDAIGDIATKVDLQAAVDLAVVQMTAELHRALRVQAAWIVGVLVGLATIASTIIALGISLFG